jgi:excisionase family DNA binding protein
MTTAISSRSTSNRDPAPLRLAAELLGVHPTTLRRWADAGGIPVALTPGGHRRFARADIEAFNARRKRLRAIGGLEQVWVDRAVEATRRDLHLSNAHPTWIDAFDEATREHHRVLGQKLMRISLSYLKAPDGDTVLLKSAERVGVQYAESFRSHGLSLSQALPILFFFRDTMLQTTLQLPDLVNLTSESSLPIFRRMCTVFNAVELAIVSSYSPGGASRRPRF